MHLKTLIETITHPERILKILKMNFGRHRNTLIISYPKSGRTWLRIMLSKLNIELNCTHDGSSWEDGATSYKKLRKNKEKYKKKKIIFVCRDPRDTIVSLYFHISRRSKIYNKSISELIRDDKYGIKKILRFNNIWFENKKTPKDFLLVKYEDLHANCFKELTRILSFLKVHRTPKEIKKAIKFSQFDNLKKLEKKGVLLKKMGGRFISTKKDDSDTYKFRKGKVGGYKNYLNKKDMHFCNKCIKELKNNFHK